MAEEKDKLLLIDFGSSVTKIGFSGELYPQFIIPTVIGYDKGFTHCFGEPKFYD